MSASAVSKGPLIVRLCNWVGEAVLSLPTLTMLSKQGYELHLVGKRWAVSLFEGHGWNVHVRPARRMDAIRQLTALRKQLARQSPGFSHRPNMVLFTSSFSSALEARLAGLKPIGYDKDGRGLLLAQRVPYKPGLHAADDYWRIGSCVAGHSAPRPRDLGLTPSVRHQALAAELMRAHNLEPGFALLCPFSGAADTTGKKLWPLFPDLAWALIERGQHVVLCPGPDEEAGVQASYPNAIVLTNVDLGTYAALSQQAAYTVSNDTGPGHLAAAAGGAVISVLGPDAAPMWRVQGTSVTVLHPDHGWPDLSDVLSALEKRRVS